RNRETAPAIISHSRRLVLRPRHHSEEPLALMLRSVAARRERRPLHSPNALRCVSKHEGKPSRSSPSFETRVRALGVCGSFPTYALLRTRTLQSSPYKQPFPLPRHALAGPIPVFSCFSADSESLPSPVSRSQTHTPPRSRGASAPEFLHPCFTHPESEGWAERRETFGCCAKHPWGVPSCVKDARERAYDAAGQAPSEAPCVP